MEISLSHWTDVAIEVPYFDFDFFVQQVECGVIPDRFYYLGHTYMGRGLWAQLRRQFYH